MISPPRCADKPPGKKMNGSVIWRLYFFWRQEYADASWKTQSCSGAALPTRRVMFLMLKKNLDCEERRLHEVEQWHDVTRGCAQADNPATLRLGRVHWRRGNRAPDDGCQRAAGRTQEGSQGVRA
jgi:hypothetical protein